MGLFWADGSCGIYEWEYTQKRENRPKEYTFNRTSYSWYICNTNIDYLNKALTYLKETYNYDFKIIKCKLKSEKCIAKKDYIYK